MNKNSKKKVFNDFFKITPNFTTAFHDISIICFYNTLIWRGQPYPITENSSRKVKSASQ